MTLTQLMRLVRPEIEQLRKMRVRWSWIAARITWVREHGIITPIPDSKTVSGLKPNIRIVSLRAAYARLRREKEQRPPVYPGRETAPVATVWKDTVNGPGAPPVQPTGPAPTALKSARVVDNPALAFKKNLEDLGRGP